jgi:hypothetical protein
MLSPRFRRGCDWLTEPNPLNKTSFMKRIINSFGHLFFSLIVTLLFMVQPAIIKAAENTGKENPAGKSLGPADETFFDQGIFLIRTSRDYRYLTIVGKTATHKMQVYTWEYADYDNQQAWKFRIQAGGFYKIQSPTGFFLAQRTLLTPTVETESNDDAQLWMLKETGDGFYSIMSKKNAYLGVTGRQKKNGAIAGFSGTFNNKPDFKWHLIKLRNEGRRMTPFNPMTMGFKFENTFRGVDASYRYSGLCGGMVYSSLDYYHAGKPIPTQNYKPANRTPLQSYIYGRQNNSTFDSNLDKWAELRLDALGTRDAEFFRWGIQGFNGGRLEELKRAIDANKPVPLGLYAGRANGLNGEIAGDHQVLAIGYAAGRYTGNLKGHRGDLKIFIYNPNNPNKTMTLVPDMANNCYLEVESGYCWRSYFVDSKYSPRTPPDILALNANEPDGSIRHIYVEFKTGGDDLRGGFDNANLVVNYKDGSTQTFANVNKSARWVDNNDETVPLLLNRAVSKADITSFTIAVTFGGGIAGDNWNLDLFRVSNGGNFTIVCSNCGEKDKKPLFRFTGQAKILTIPIR